MTNLLESSEYAQMAHSFQKQFYRTYSEVCVKNVLILDKNWPIKQTTTKRNDEKKLGSSLAIEDGCVADKAKQSYISHCRP